MGVLNEKSPSPNSLSKSAFHLLHFRSSSLSDGHLPSKVWLTTPIIGTVDYLVILPPGKLAIFWVTITALL